MTCINRKFTNSTYIYITEQEAAYAGETSCPERKRSSTITYRDGNYRSNG